MPASKYSKAKKALRAKKIRRRGMSSIKGKTTPGYISYDDIKKVNDLLSQNTDKNSSFIFDSESAKIKAILEKASASITPQKINNAWRKACLKSG